MKFTKLAIAIILISIIALCYGMFNNSAKLSEKSATIDKLREQIIVLQNSEFDYKKMAKQLQITEAYAKIREIEQADTLSLEQKVYVLSMLMSNSVLYRSRKTTYLEPDWGRWTKYLDGILEDK